MATTVVTGLTGANLNSYDADPQFALGTTVTATDGAIFEYVQAASAFSAFNAVAIADTGIASNLTTTNAAEVRRVGVTQISIAVSCYGWVQRSGKMRVNVLVNCQDFVPLFTTATPGHLDDVTVSEALVLGINAVNSTTTVSAVTAIGASPLQIFPFANPA
jgi:hypothetical protein